MSITDKVGNQESNNNLNMYYMIAKLDNMAKLLYLVNCGVWHAGIYEFDFIALVHNWFHI